jgi:hypothetical protein
MGVAGRYKNGISRVTGIEKVWTANEQQIRAADSKMGYGSVTVSQGVAYSRVRRVNGRE